MDGRLMSVEAVEQDNVVPISAEAQKPLAALKEIVRQIEDGEVQAPQAMFLALMTNKREPFPAPAIFGVGLSDLEALGWASKIQSDLATIIAAHWNRS